MTNLKLHFVIMLFWFGIWRHYFKVSNIIHTSQKETTQRFELGNTYKVFKCTRSHGEISTFRVIKTYTWFLGRPKIRKCRKNWTTFTLRFYLVQPHETDALNSVSGHIQFAWSVYTYHWQKLYLDILWFKVRKQYRNNLLQNIEILLLWNVSNTHN